MWQDGHLLMYGITIYSTPGPVIADQILSAQTGSRAAWTDCRKMQYTPYCLFAYSHALFPTCRSWLTCMVWQKLRLSSASACRPTYPLLNHRLLPYPAFTVDTFRLWNTLAQNVTSAQSLTVRRKPLKTSSVVPFHNILYSAHAAIVISDTNRPFLLTYLLVDLHGVQSKCWLISISCSRDKGTRSCTWHRHNS